MKINQLKVGAALSYISMGLGYSVSIIYTPIMLRLLGQSDYGLYNLVSSVIAYLGVLNFGFGSAYMRYYSKYSVKDDTEKIASLNGMFLIIFSILGLIAVIAGIILTLNAETIFGSGLTLEELSRAKTLLIILVFNLAVSFPNIVFTSHITANEKFIFQKIVEMIRIIANPFVVLPLLILGYGSIGMVLATTTLNILIATINIFYCLNKMKMKFIFTKFDFVLMKEMTVFSSFIFINLLIDQINWNIDKLVIGRFHGTVAVAIYGLAAQLNTYYMSLSTAISTVFIPRVHKLIVKNVSNKDLTLLFTKIGRIQFLLLSLVASGLVFFGKPFIKMWAGETYSDSYAIALWLIIPVTIPLIQNIGIEIQRAKNMHRFRSVVYFIIAIGNLFLTIPLAKAYGGRGAAIGTAISLFLGNGIIMNWYNHFKVGLDMKFFWKEIASLFPSLLLPVFSGVIIVNNFDLNNFKVFFLSGLFFVIVFCSSMFLLGMNQYEKELFSKPLKKTFKRIFN